MQSHTPRLTNARAFLYGIGMLAIVMTMLFSGPRTASAATVAELQAQVQAILAQIAAMQGGTAPGASCFGFSRSLTIGSRGDDVTALQNFLASKGHFKVATTGYFGPITAAAVAQWQASNGVTPASGFFGPLSRAKYGGSCGIVVVPPPAISDDDDDDNDDDAGSLQDFDQMDLSDEEVSEDDEDIEVLGVEFKAKDADQRIDRVIVIIDNPSEASEDDLEDFISDVSVWLDHEELGRMDIDDADHDSDEDTYTFAFTGLDGDLDEGEMGELTIAVSGANSLDEDVEGEGWDIEIPDDGIRASSPDGSTKTYDGVGPEQFTVGEDTSSSDDSSSSSIDAKAPVVVFQADDPGEESIGKFVIEFTVTALNTDVWLDKSTDSSGTSGQAGEGVVFTVDSDGTPSNISAILECVSDCGDASDNSSTDFFIEEGDAETYRLTVHVTAEAGGTSYFYSLWIDSFNWATADNTGNKFTTSRLGEGSDAHTSSLYLNSL